MATTTQGVTSTATNTPRSNGIKESGHPVTDKLQETLHSSLDKVAGPAGRAEENLRSTAADSAKNMSARKKDAEQKWKTSAVRKYAVENPFAAAGIAFAAGMLVTSLLRNK